jgi:hypothetical protein
VSSSRLIDATAEGARDRFKKLFAHDFTPQFRYEQMSGAEERIAYAAEFAACRLGQIDEKLGRLIAIMERGNGKSS